MPRSTRTSLSAAFAASFAPAVSSAATCVSPTPGDRKSTAMFRKRQRDWRMEDDVSDVEQPTTSAISGSHSTAHRVLHTRHARPYQTAAASPSFLRQRRRLSDDDWSAWKRADHDGDDDHDHDAALVADRDEEEQDSGDDAHGDSGSPFKEIQSRVEQVGLQVAQAQRNVAELRALLRKAITSQRKALATRPPVPTKVASGTARVRIDMLCS